MKANETFYDQYHRIKQQYPSHLVIFRLGDFFEAFDEDADRMGALLDLPVIKVRGQTHRMSGFPAAVAEQQLAQLIQKGCTIAMVEQIDPKALPESAAPQKLITNRRLIEGDPK